jgi:hypothetical protein
MEATSAFEPGASTALEHPQAQRLSDRQIAKHVGVAPITVGEWRKKLTPVEPTIRNVQSPIRTGADGRSINTANIGRKPLTMPNPTRETRGHRI